MNFISHQNIYLGISNKKDGPMKSSLENRFLFFKNKGLADKNTISAGLADSNKVIVVDDIDTSQRIENCDALITNQSQYLLTITVADCLPIYFYDKNKNIIALAHAGWRGVLLNITQAVIDVFLNHYDSNLEDLEVYIGPHIKDCCFEVKNDVLNQFKSAHCITIGEKTYINLASAVKDQLLTLKVSEEKISISDECTSCLNKKYFSYRRDKPRELETMIAYIGIK